MYMAKFHLEKHEVDKALELYELVLQLESDNGKFEKSFECLEKITILSG